VTLLEETADELYGLPPDQFTSVRDAKAKEARSAGDARGAVAIKALRRPTASAWLVNLVVRTHTDDFQALLDLGRQLRVAQRNLSGDDLRRLSQERQLAVSNLAREAMTLAGQQMSDLVSREITSTLEAAVADENAADAVRSGRLTKALSYSGFGPVDVTAAVGLAVGKKASNEKKAKPSTAPRPDSGERQAAVTAAKRRATDAAKALDKAIAAHARLKAQADDLEARLTALRAKQERLEQAEQEAKRESEAAAAAVLETEKALRSL